MKRILTAILILGLCVRPSSAFFGGDVIAAARYAKDQAYQTFMKIKMVQQLRVMKQNYDSSMRYYREYQRLNSGQGFFHNLAEQIKGGSNQIYYELESQIDRDFINTYNTDTKVDRMFSAMHRKIQSNLKYTADRMVDIAFNRNQGKKIASGAKGLSPKEAANLSAQAQGLQLQMLVQLHEDNLRLIELQSMRLAVEQRKRRQRLKSLESLRRGVKRRAPGALPDEEDDDATTKKKGGFLGRWGKR